MKVEIYDLGFRYSGTSILENIQFQVAPSELVAICGPNGVGKSTLISCINRIQRPSCGRIALVGRELNSMSLIDIAKHVGYVPQTATNAFPMTVFDMVLMGRRPHLGWRSSDADEDKVVEVLKLMGIEDLALRDFNELSGGQQQKIIIARALAQDPDVLLLDEPTSNLDIRHQLEVMEIIKGLVQDTGMSAFIAVHDLNLAGRYADRVVMMKNGRIFCDGGPETVLTPENIMSVYGVESVVKDEGGRPYVVPLRHNSPLHKSAFSDPAS